MHMEYQKWLLSFWLMQLSWYKGQSPRQKLLISVEYGELSLDLLDLKLFQNSQMLLMYTYELHR